MRVGENWIQRRSPSVSWRAHDRADDTNHSCISVLSSSRGPFSGFLVAVVVVDAIIGMRVLQ